MSATIATIKQQLAELVAIPSVSAVDAAFDMSNLGVVDRLADWYSAAGFELERQVVCEKPEKQNLIATLGRGEGGLLLSGHTDTVPYDTTRWDSDPFVLDERDGCWYGLGSADMKCFFPIVLAALEGIDPGALKKPLRMLATADEESSMDGARVVSARAAGVGSLGQYAIIGEPTQLIPVYQHKGIVIARLVLTGQSGHSSNPALGRNALDCMHNVMSAFKTWRETAQARFQSDHFDVPVPTMNFGRIVGGDSPNRICASCELLFDVRMMPGMDADETVAELTAIVKAEAEAANIEWQLDLPVEPVPPLTTDPQGELTQNLVALSGNAGRTVAFATEGPFLSALGCESVVFGPGNIDCAHQPNEFVEIERVAKMVEILRKLIIRMCCDV